MDVSENSGTPKSSILIGFSIINHPFWGTPIFGNTHIYLPFVPWEYASVLGRREALHLPVLEPQVSCLLGEMFLGDEILQSYHGGGWHWGGTLRFP